MFIKVDLFLLFFIFLKICAIIIVGEMIDEEKKEKTKKII